MFFRGKQPEASIWRRFRASTDGFTFTESEGVYTAHIVANAERVLAIELLAGAQAVEFHVPLAPSPGVAAAHGFVRTLSERVTEDRSLSDDIERTAGALRRGELVAAVAAVVGPLP